MIFLDDTQIRNRLDYPTVIALVEAAFAADALGQVQLMPVIGQTLIAYDARWGVKAGYLKLDFQSVLLEVMGLKQGWFSSKNAALGLPNHAATMLIAEPATGALKAVLSANVITEMRTAAAGAIAAKYLSRADSSHVAILGVGEQGHAQLEALCCVRDITQVRVWSRRAEAIEEFVTKHQHLGFEILGVNSAKEAVQNADVIVCTTPSREPILESDWVKAGTHINAIGSDAPGKQELATDLIASNIFFTDKRQQSQTIGEMQQPLATGLVNAAHIRAELGELIVEQTLFDRKQDDITIFDSSGVSFQDLVVAGWLIHQLEQERTG